jgi:DNA-binding transcriptional ArsR family regulator
MKNDDARRASSSLIQLLANPIRLRILLATAEDSSGRCSWLTELHEQLADHVPDLEVRQVAYHVGRLRSADLLPKAPRP